jgi:hypothetical protein
VSLLEKALEAKVPGVAKRGASADELELAVAFFHGRVSSKQVAVALGQEKAFGVAAWAARVLQVSLQDGRCSLVIGDPEETDEDAEFDRRHEEAKAAPLSALGKAARR